MLQNWHIKNIQILNLYFLPVLIVIISRQQKAKYDLKKLTNPVTPTILNIILIHLQSSVPSLNYTLQLCLGWVTVT